MASKLFDQLYERRYISAFQTLVLYFPLLALIGLLLLVLFLGTR